MIVLSFSYLAVIDAHLFIGLNDKFPNYMIVNDKIKKYSINL